MTLRNGDGLEGRNCRDIAGQLSLLGMGQRVNRGYSGSSATELAMGLVIGVGGTEAEVKV